MKLTLITIATLSLLWLSSCGAKSTNSASGQDNATLQTVSGTNEPSGDGSNPVSGTPIHLNKAGFLSKVYDYEKNPNEWVFAGEKPCIVDFYADWCKPCKMIAPIMAELAGEYSDQITVYKINIDEERELAQYFGIQSIPTILFCPLKGKPQMTQGAQSKESFEKVVKDVLIGEKTK